MTTPANLDNLEHVGCPTSASGRTLCGQPTTDMNEVVGNLGVSGAPPCVVCVDIETNATYCPQCGERMLHWTERLRRWRPW